MSMINTKIFAINCLVIILLLGSCNNETEKYKHNSNAPEQSTQVLTKRQWIEDFEELYSYLKTNHRNLYHKTPPSNFERLFVQIKKDIPGLSDYEIIVQFARFVALVNDGHTRLTLPLREGLGLGQAHSKTPLPVDTSLVFHHLPIEFYWFDDGLYINKAISSYRHLIGKKVIQINDIPFNEALERTRSISHFDNEYGYKLVGPSRLSIFEVLKALKISDDENEVTILIEFRQSNEKITIKPLNRFSKQIFFENVKEIPIISFQRNKEYYWYQYLANQKAIYLQVNQMNDAKNGPDLIKFIGQLNNFINTNEVNRIILDLRNNFGGDNTYSLPIANLIIKNPNLNKIGSFYTLIGRKTFSAAQYLINDLSKWTNVIFVGEPTGASPNSYGDSRKKRLKNSNLTVRISSIYWRDWTSNENRKWIAPDIPVENIASNFFQNKDEALKVCLNFKTSNKLVDTYNRLYETGGMETGKRLYLRVALDWERTDIEVKSIENKLIQWMSENEIE